MRRARLGLREFACLHVLLALLVQFAPTIHALAPHDHASSACKHGATSLHFESTKGDGDESPCLLCAHLLGRQALLIAVGLQWDASPTVRSSTSFPDVGPGICVLQLPDSRGPPAAL